jgi:hypothetical protein
MVEWKIIMKNDLDNERLPIHIIDKAYQICNYMSEQGYVNWELGGLCSRNCADKVRVYEDFVNFINEKDFNLNVKQKELPSL